MKILSLTDEEVLDYHNPNLQDIVTPVDPNKLEELLVGANYDSEKNRFLVEGFRNGFEVGYKGSRTVKLNAPNLKFRGVRNKTILWNKVMKEVKLKCFASPFERIPFKYYIQSPIGLVPKDGGKATRLIFHLSYPRG